MENAMDAVIRRTASAGEGRLAVLASLTRTGAGAVIELFGGERPHVGCVVVSQPRPSLTGDGSTSVTSSVISLLSHKDEGVARPAAERAAIALGEPVVCVAGVHVDDATPEELRALSDNARLAVERLLEQI